MRDLMKVMKLVIVEKKDIMLSIFFGFMAGIAAIGLFASSGYMISKSALAPPLYALTVLIAVLKLFSLTRAASRYGERYFSHRATFTILSRLRVSFYEKLEPLAPGIFHKYRSGDLLARIVGDVESLQNFFLRVFYPPIVLVIVFLSTILFTSYYSLSIALLLLVGLVLTSVASPMLSAMKQRKIEHHVREGRAELSTETTEFLYGFRDLKIYQRLAEKERQLLQSSESYLKEQERAGLQAIFSQSVNSIIALIISWLVLAVGAYLVTAGQLDGIFLAMLVMISLTVFENAAPMAVFPAHLEDSRRAATRLFTVVQEDAPKPETTFTSLPAGQPLAMEMEDVSFKFPDETRYALKNVSLQLPAGSKTAIVGPSGSGKSTLLQLLLKMYPAGKGSIRINGTSIHELPQESIWEAANVILQENHFFYGTVRDNLLLANSSLTDEEMIAALAKVQLNRFSLSDHVFEKGENLSGGERQRLAIARAFLRGAALWFLDEPTSSVDALTEQVIFDHLFQQAGEDTLVLVSHRLTGLETFDQIIVMEQGTIIEAGTFSALMEKKGYFYEMKQIEKSVLM